MNKRKAKKQMKPGMLFTIQGTHVVGMSLGFKGNNEIDSFNLVDLVSGKPVKRCDGKCRIATRKEQYCYWAALRHIIKNKEE